MNFKALALAATVAIGGMAVAPEAKAGAMYTLNDGTEIEVTDLGYGNYETIRVNRYDDTGFIMFSNCTEGTWRARAVDGHDRESLRGWHNATCKGRGY